MKTALIVMDMQKGFINENTEQITGRIKNLLEKKLFDFAVFTQFINLPGSLFQRLIGFERLKEKPETEIVEELRPYAGKIFSKNTYTPFTKELEDYLEKNKITILYFAGIDTNACIMLGAADAFDKGYIPFVLGDYCASHNGEKFHLSALKNLEKIIGKRQVIKGTLEKLPS